MNSNTIIKFTKGAVGGAVDAWINTDPRLAVVWGAIKGGVNAVRTERAEEFVTIIQKNISLEQSNNPQIMDGVSIAFEEFVRQRNKEKRKLIENIFLGYVTEKDKEKIELERMYQIVNQISLDSLQFLFFLNEKILPTQWTINGDISRLFITFFSKNENKIEYSKYLDSKEAFAELSGLGVVRFSGYAVVSDPSNGQDNVYYAMTNFGFKFLRFLTNQKKQ